MATRSTKSDSVPGADSPSGADSPASGGDDARGGADQGPGDSIGAAAGLLVGLDLASGVDSLGAAVVSPAGPVTVLSSIAPEDFPSQLGDLLAGAPADGSDPFADPAPLPAPNGWTAPPITAERAAAENAAAEAAAEADASIREIRAIQAARAAAGNRRGG